MFLDSANTSGMDEDGLETLLNEREISAEGGRKVETQMIGLR